MSKRPYPSPKVDGRAAVLIEQRRLKMARSAHAYVRGNTQRFYQWLEDGAGRALPEGPAIWICGDCHLGNLGPLASADGDIDVQIRDLDQTVIGNPAHDLVRLGLSLATAARGADLPGVTTAKMLEEMVAGYRDALLGADSGSKSDRPRSIKKVLRQANRRKWRHLARERIEDVKPNIPLGERFWALSSRERSEIGKLFETEAVRTMVTALRGRDSASDIEVLDAAYWMKGCSSLGRLRYAVLVQVGKTGDADNGGLCLVDIKEATHPAAPRSPSGSMPRDDAERVVAGARALSPFLGGRMLAATFMDKSVVLRELMPQDLKLEIDKLTQQEAVRAAHYLASVVGKAHARQLDETARHAWSEEMNKRSSGDLDAPHWLWSSVVDLVSVHEVAYLEHCRRYALGVAA
ncbi:MAG TPA: DUF2252 family protein [Caulobacteraceae bacterium]|jgi:uncharacterized protein (DUF2252 family)